MADAKLKIIIDADDKASDDIKKINKSLDQTAESSKKANTSFKGTFTEMASAIQVAQIAYQALNEIVDQTVGLTVEYAAEVRDLQRASGMSAEETSKIIQVFDDMNVSSETLKESLRKMSQEGITFSVEKMAEMSDKYLLLEEGSERNKFLLDNFGRAGLEMGKALEIGSDAIKQMADEMDGSLILTQDNVDAAREYEIQLDELNDAVMGIKVSIGNELIPVLTQAAEILTDTSDAMIAAKEAANQANNPMVALAYEVDQLNKYVYTASDGIDDMTESWANNYQQSQTTIPSIQDTSGAISDLTEITWTASEAMKGYSEQLLFAEASEGLTSDQALALAESMGLVDNRTVFATEKTAIYQQMLRDHLIDNERYNELVKQLGDNLSRITDKSATISIHTVYTSSGDPGGYSGVTLEERASGGPVVPGHTYIVGEDGPEILQMGRNGGQVIPNSITNNYNLGVTTMNSAATVSRSFAIMQALQ